MDYNRFFPQVGRLIWRHRFLWALGLLATIGSLSGGLAGRLFQPFPVFGSADPLGDLAASYDRWVRPGPMAAVVGGVFVAGMLIWVISAMAEGGLIRAVDDLARDQAVDFGSAWSTGVRLLGRFIAIDTILFFPLFVVVLLLMLVALGALIGLVVTAQQPGAVVDDLLTVVGVAVACLVPLLIALLPVSLFIAVFRLLSFRSAALYELGARDSLRHSWRVFRRFLGDILLHGLLLWGLRYAATLVVSIITLPLAAIGLIPLVMSLSAGSLPGTAEERLFTIAGLLVVIVSALPAALIHSYLSAAWTIAYRRWGDAL